MDLIFVDCETSGLLPEQHTWWELAVIRRTPDGHETTHLWQRRLDKWELEKADPDALAIGRYHERLAVHERERAADMSHVCGLPHHLDASDLPDEVHEAVKDAVMVGSNPAFDAAFLRDYLDCAPWHYRVVDIATLAAGYVQGLGTATQYPGKPVDAMPWKSRDLSRAVGVEPPGDDGHQALVDARWARDVYDAVTGARQAVERAA